MATLQFLGCISHSINQNKITLKKFFLFRFTFCDHRKSYRVNRMDDDLRKYSNEKTLLLSWTTRFAKLSIILARQNHSSRITEEVLNYVISEHKSVCVFHSYGYIPIYSQTMIGNGVLFLFLTAFLQKKTDRHRKVYSATRRRREKKLITSFLFLD